MKRALLLCTLAASSIAFVGSARADQFTISFTDAGSFGNVSSGSFTVDATALGSGVFQVTGVESGGSADTGLGTYAVTGISGGLGADDELFVPADPGFFDGNGLSFSLLNGATINLYSDGGTTTWAYEELVNDNQYFNPVNVSVTPVESASPVPEPSTLVLVGTSVLGIVGTLRKRLLA